MDWVSSPTTVKKESGVKAIKDLDGATICVQTGTTTELNLADYFRTHKLKFQPVVIEKEDEVTRAFFSGRCDAFTSDVSQLAGVRSTQGAKASDYVILPELISKEPLTPAVRHGDDQWFDVVKWTVFALFQAEESGITSKNVDESLKSTNPEIQRFLGVTPGMGKALGVDEKWAYNLIKQVGNYGEVFERNVGSNTPLKLERGLNRPGIIVVRYARRAAPQKIPPVNYYRHRPPLRPSRSPYPKRNQARLKLRPA